jgi:hypothetical protein
MKTHLMRLLGSAIVAILLVASAWAQANPAGEDDRGLTSYVLFGGTANSDGQIYLLNSSIGYNLNKHFGVDLGVPVYFVNASSISGGVSGNGVGNPSLDVRWKFLSPTLSYGAVLTGSAPLGNTNIGLNTGRATFDWTNRVEHSFSRVTPFFEAGLSNTTSDSRLFVRPYTTLGLNTHFRPGAEISLWKSIAVGGSAYDIVPFGNQTVFSRVNNLPGGSAAGTSHGRAFQSSQQTIGTAAIARDDGFSTWVDTGLNPYIDTEIGYTRSVHYDLNSVSFSLGFNVGRLLRRSARQ